MEEQFFIDDCCLLSACTAAKIIIDFLIRWVEMRLRLGKQYSNGGNKEKVIKTEMNGLVVRWQL